VSLHVLMTTDTVGGVWDYTLELIAALSARDVDVTLATLGVRLDRTQARAVGALANVHVFESSYRVEWMDDAWDDVDAAGDWLVHLEAQVHPDVVHVNGYSHAALPFKAPALCVAHSCVGTWYRAVRGREMPPEWATYRARVSAGLQAARLVVAPTAAILGEILAEYGAAVPSRIIPHGCDAAPWPRAEKEPFAITIGRMWDEAKNIGVIDAAAAHVTWPIYLAGSTRSPGGWVAEPSGVKVLGDLSADSLAGWLSRASICVHAAKYEPFGFAPIHAALAGCALVLGDLATLREVWGDAAVYVAPDDGRALAAAIGTLIRDPLRRRALAAAARRRALALSATGMADAYDALYRELAAGAGAICA
jgi:glycosyltransferase involved in cell wall biosynthesis